MEMKPIIIVGCGPGGPEYMTPAARQEIARARVLIGPARLLDLFPQAAEQIVVGADVGGVLDAMAARLAAGPLVVLVTGDPGLCSMAQPVIRRFGRAACHVIPGISSLQAAFAAVAEEWFGARILSAHNTAPSIAPADLVGEQRLALLAGNPANAAWVEALSATLMPTHEIFLCENMTLPDESVRHLQSLTIPMKLASRSILIFIRKDLRL